MISTEMTARILRIAFDDREGTGFLHNRGGRQYLVTARHVVGDSPATWLFKLMHEGRWKGTPYQLVGHAERGQDVSVLAVPYPLMISEAAPPPDAAPNLTFAMDAYFLGFPFGLFGDFGALVRDYPFPFAKKAIVASLADREGLFYLDGINNEGFSGGPVIVRHHESRAHAVAGVVSGYTAELAAVLDDEAETGLIVQQNSGLVRAFHINVANLIIDNNPIGTPLPNGHNKNDSPDGLPKASE